MQVIVRQSGDKSEFQDSSVEKILKLLFNHCESEEEGVRNVVAECLGKIALIEPVKLVPALKVFQMTFYVYPASSYEETMPSVADLNFVLISTGTNYQSSCIY